MGPDDDGEEVVDDSIKEQIDCYRDKDRICGPDCVAWVTSPPEDKGRLTFTQRHCLALASVERTARHTTIIASTLVDLFKKSRTESADRQREAAKGSPQATQLGPFASPFPNTPGTKP